MIDNYHAYMLRIDLSPDYHAPDPGIASDEEAYVLTKILNSFLTWWFKLPDDTEQIANDSGIPINALSFYYIWAYEIAPVTNKHHIQAICWFNEKLPETHHSKIRNFFKKFTIPKSHNPVAFTKSISPKSLASYCSKDGKYIHNLSTKLLLKIPSWRDNLNKQKEEQSAIFLIKKELKEWYDTPMGLDSSWFMVCKKINQLYVKYTGTPCLYRSTYMKLGYYLGIFDFFQIWSTLNLDKT